MCIPGGKRPEQVEENVRAADLPPLNPETMSAIEDIYNRLIRPKCITIGEGLASRACLGSAGVPPANERGARKRLSNRASKTTRLRRVCGRTPAVPDNHLSLALRTHVMNKIRLSLWFIPFSRRS